VSFAAITLCVASQRVFVVISSSTQSGFGYTVVYDVLQVFDEIS
jgi:hypothetical protein